MYARTHSRTLPYYGMCLIINEWNNNINEMKGFVFLDKTFCLKNIPFLGPLV